MEVSGNSGRGGGGGGGGVVGGKRFQSQNFLRKVWGLTGISRGVGGFKPKNLLWEGYGGLFGATQFPEGFKPSKSVAKAFGEMWRDNK